MNFDMFRFPPSVKHSLWRFPQIAETNTSHPLGFSFKKHHLRQQSHRARAATEATICRIAIRFGAFEWRVVAPFGAVRQLRASEMIVISALDFVAVFRFAG